jgi:hypothetical protein
VVELENVCVCGVFHEELKILTNENKITEFQPRLEAE